MSIKTEANNMETDAALVMDIKAGNKTALGKLVERHKRLAFRLALGLVGNKDDAYDNIVIPDKHKPLFIPITVNVF